MASPTTRNFLITGAGRGIGRGLSRLLLQRGHRVLLVDYNDEELTHTTSQLSQTHKAGADFDSLNCNVRNPSDILSAVEKAKTLFSGHLDCLINNAACEFLLPAVVTVTSTIPLNDTKQHPA